MSNLGEKLIDLESAFDHPVTVGIVIGIGVLLVVTPIVFEALSRRGVVNETLRKELYLRYKSWLVMAPLIAGPVLLGPGCLMLAIGLLSLACYAEFARATGFFRHRLLSLVVVLGVLLLTFAALDHWYNFFVALPSLTIAILAVAAILADEPKGYIQRVALGALSYLLFGFCLAHLGYMANDALYRPLVLAIVVSVELNDVFAFCTGKLFGRRKIAPNTSPNKTLGGCIGALILTTMLFATLAHFIFKGTSLDTPVHLITMGLILSLAGQFGDLVISSVKRDLGVKDMGAIIPGHGGLLDRFDSLLLVPPALFHYIGYFIGFGVDQPTRIITG